MIDLLADRTFPQLRAIDAVYHEKYDKTLLELIESEGALKNNSAFAVRTSETCS